MELHDIGQEDDAIQGDLDAIIFNPIASTILKWLGFKFVRWKHDVHPCTAMVWDCLHCWITMVASHIIFS
jgi:hypothetical protein